MIFWQPLLWKGLKRFLEPVKSEPSDLLSASEVYRQREGRGEKWTISANAMVWEDASLILNYILWLSYIAFKKPTLPLVGLIQRIGPSIFNFDTNSMYTLYPILSIIGLWQYLAVIRGPWWYYPFKFNFKYFSFEGGMWWISRSQG